MTVRLFRRSGFGENLAAAIPTGQTVARRNRNAFVTTETELKLIAKAAIIGDNSIPVQGYSNPAATGTPNAL